MPEHPWAIARVELHQEARAAAALERIGFDSYLPRCVSFSYYHGKKRRHMRPLFLGYIFIWIEGRHWPAALGAEHVHRFLGPAEAAPTTISDDIIAELRAREGPDGCIPVAKAPEPLRFYRGQRVKIRQGPLTGLDATFERHCGGERVRVVVPLLGQQRSVMLRIDALEPDIVGALEHTKQKRRKRKRRQRARRRTSLRNGAWRPCAGPLVSVSQPRH